MIATIVVEEQCRESSASTYDTVTQSPRKETTADNSVYRLIQGEMDSYRTRGIIQFLKIPDKRGLPPQQLGLDLTKKWFINNRSPDLHTVKDRLGLGLSKMRSSDTQHNAPVHCFARF